jgi:hypothetical protein
MITSDMTLAFVGMGSLGSLFWVVVSRRRYKVCRRTARSKHFANWFKSR